MTYYAALESLRLCRRQDRSATWVCASTWSISTETRLLSKHYCTERTTNVFIVLSAADQQRLAIAMSSEARPGGPEWGTDISPTCPVTFTTLKKCEFCLPFLTRVDFKSLWFRIAATYVKFKGEDVLTVSDDSWRISSSNFIMVAAPTLRNLR